MDLLMGLTGALMLLTGFFGGVFLGWRARGLDAGRSTKVTAQPLTEAQKRRLRDQREAWNALQGYGVEDAYNLHPGDRGDEGGD